MRWLPCLILDSSKEGFRLRGSFDLRRGQVVELILDEDMPSPERCSVVWVGKAGFKQEGEGGAAQDFDRLLQAKAVGEAPVPKVLLDSLDAGDFSKLLDGKGKLLSENDDIAPGNLDARLIFTPSALVAEAELAGSTRSEAIAATAARLGVRKREVYDAVVRAKQR